MIKKEEAMNKVNVLLHKQTFLLDFVDFEANNVNGITCKRRQNILTTKNSKVIPYSSYHFLCENFTYTINI